MPEAWQLGDQALAAAVEHYSAAAYTLCKEKVKETF